MPHYDYHCENCEHDFTVDLPITVHEKRERNHELRCPKCDSPAVKHVINSIFVTTSKKS